MMSDEEFKRLEEQVKEFLNRCSEIKEKLRNDKE